MDPTRQTVLVADEHPAFRTMLARRVRGHPDLELAAEFADGSGALAGIRTLRPAVAVLDIRLPITGAFGVLAAIGAEDVSTRVVILSLYADPALIVRALRLGARGFLSKDATLREICDAIATVARGELVFPATIGPHLVYELHEEASSRAQHARTNGSRR